VKSFGFTLIELLIVIAIIGTLGVVVLLAVNPLERIARSRDAGRINGIVQIGRAVESYYITHNAFPRTDNWLQQLVDNGDLVAMPDEIPHSSGYYDCTRYNENGWCYHRRITPLCAMVFTALESEVYKSRCEDDEVPYIYYDTIDRRAGMLCYPEGTPPGTRHSCESWTEHGFYEPL